VTRRSSASAIARLPTDRRSTAVAPARPRGGDLRLDELTPLEQKLGSGRATSEEVEAALQALGRRALESPEGYVAVRAFDPDDLDDDP
jgi:hypothetical protein